MSPMRPPTLSHGRYELLDSIGTGGMATVVRARDHQTGAILAIKLLLPKAARSEKLRRRFLAEAQTMERLRHPNVVRVLEVGEEDEQYYFVMELAGGGSIADHLRRYRSCPAPEAMAMMFQVLRGLDYAHAEGLVHRDIKPHNMLLAHPRGPDEPAPVGLHALAGEVKLTDFGIAKHMVAPGPRITGTGDTLGSLAYMAPEQRADPRSAQLTSDIYGVGATLYMMITARRPFDIAVPGSRDLALERVPAPLRTIVARATDPEAGERYPSARAMAGALVEAWGRMRSPGPDDPMLAFDSP